MKQISVVVVDPNQLVREGLERLLSKPEFSIVAAGRTLEEVLDRCASLVQADVIVLGSSTEIDVEEQIAAMHQVRAEPRRGRFVFVTEVRKPDLLRRVLASGADALLSKDISGEIFRRSLELVMLGQKLFPISLVPSVADVAESSATLSSRRITLPPFPASTVAPTIVGQRPSPQPQTDLPTQQGRIVLSGRENQILGYLVNAFSNKAIARELQIAEATVKVHIKALLRKIRASSRTQAAAWAVSNKRVFNDAPGKMDFSMAATSVRCASLEANLHIDRAKAPGLNTTAYGRLITTSSPTSTRPLLPSTHLVQRHGKGPAEDIA